MRRLFIFTACLSSALSTATAQTRPGAPQGYIVRTAGDTVRGTITIPRFVSERGVTFQPQATGAKQVLYPRDVRAFGLIGGPAYETRLLTLQRKESLDTKQLVNRAEELLVFAQVLVRGFASLYQLDYNFVPSQGTALEVSSRQTRFYLLAHPRLPGSPLQGEDNFRANMRQLFVDCAAATALVPAARFEPNSLATVVLAYNSCYAEPPSQDLRPPVDAAATPTTTAWSVQLGAARPSLQYHSPTTSFQTGSGGEPKFSGAESTLSPTITASLRFARAQARISYLLGVQLGQYRSVGTNTYTVPLGFYNAGEQLQMRNEVKLLALQLPLSVRYSFGQPQARLRPFLQAGPAFEFHFNNRTDYQIAATGFDASSRYVTRVQQQQVDYGFNFALAGTVCAGLSQQVGAHRVLADINYSLSRQLSNNGTQGYLSGSVIGARVGFEW